MLSTPATDYDDDDEQPTVPDPLRSSAPNLEEDLLSTSLGGFRKLDLNDKPRRGKKSMSQSKKAAKLRKGQLMRRMDLPIILPMMKPTDLLRRTQFLTRFYVITRLLLAFPQNFAK